MAEPNVYPLTIPEVMQLIEDEGLTLNEELVEYNQERAGARDFVYDYKEGVVLIPMLSHQAYVFKYKEEFITTADNSAKEASKYSSQYQMITSVKDFRKNLDDEVTKFKSLADLPNDYLFTYSIKEVRMLDEILNHLPNEVKVKWIGAEYYRALLSYSIKWIETNTNCIVGFHFHPRSGTFYPIPVVLEGGRTYDWTVDIFRDIVEGDRFNLANALLFVKNKGCSDSKPKP